MTKQTLVTSGHKRAFTPPYSEAIKRNAMFRTLRTVFIGVVLAYSGFANAGLIFTLDEVGDDVVINGSGSFDLNGINVVNSNIFDSGFINSSEALSVGSGNHNSYAGFTSGAGAFGTGTFVRGNLSSGDYFSFDRLQSGLGVLGLPTNYVSGASLAGTTSILNSSFASLGLITGTYVYSTSMDTVTINIRATSVPEPGSVALLLLGLIGLFTQRRHTA